MPKQEQMTVIQALSLLADLGELEVNSPACPDPPESWIYELRQAVRVVRELLAEQRPPCGRFEMSAITRRANGKTRAHTI